MGFALLAGVGTGSARAQELIPAAYTPAPVGAHLISVATSYSSGEVNFEPSAPIEDASARIWGFASSYATTFGLIGRSANVTVIVPYITGDVSGRYLGEQASASRAGFADLSVRLGANLLGAPSMTPREFAEWERGTMLGASLTARAPTGQYDSERLINIGTNRWSFKPELGFVQPLGRVAIDFYLGGWFFTRNTSLYGGNSLSQAPILSTEIHIRIDLGDVWWLSLDGNYWNGGRSRLDGVSGDDRQRESRVGGTAVVRLARGHRLRVVASTGAISRVGGDFDSIGLSYAYNW